MKKYFKILLIITINLLSNVAFSQAITEYSCDAPTECHSLTYGSNDCFDYYYYAWSSHEWGCSDIQYILVPTSDPNFRNAPVCCDQYIDRGVDSCVDGCGECGVSASASTGGQVCNSENECGSSVDSGDECSDQFVAVPDDGWVFGFWNIPETTDSCTYHCEGNACQLSSQETICPGVQAYFNKKEDDELCDLYPAHDDYAVQVTGSKKDGACYEGITVVSSVGDEFNFSFSENHDPSQNTAASLDSPWMTAADWKEFCSNQVMPSQYCFDSSEDEEFDPLEPPPEIDPIDPITEDELDDSPDTQDPEDQGEWAINDNLKKMDSNQQKRYDGLTGYLQELAQKIASAIDSSKSQNHRDLQTLDHNQQARNNQLISAVKASKSEFKDEDDTDEDKIADLIDGDRRQYMQEQHDATQGINFDGIPEDLPTEEDFTGAEVTDQDISDLDQGLQTERQNAVDAFDTFQSTSEVNDIKDKFEVRLINQDCSFTVTMLGTPIEFSFCQYGNILDYMGTIVLFISWIWVLHYVLRG